MPTQEELRAKWDAAKQKRSGEPAAPTAQETLRAKWDAEKDKQLTAMTEDPFASSVRASVLPGVAKQIATGMADPVYGAMQLAQRGNDKLFGTDTAGKVDQHLEDRESQYKAENPDVQGFDPLREVGTALSPVTWVGPKKVQMAGRVGKGLVEALGKHTGLNAAQSMAMPVVNDKSGRSYTDTQMQRAGLGALLGSAVGGGGAALNNVIKQWQIHMAKAPDQAIRYLKEEFGDRAEEVANKLEKLTSDVPGEKPTAAWLAAEDASLPNIASLEKQARSGDLAGDFAQRDEDNFLAKLDVFDELQAGGERPVVNNREMRSPIQQQADRAAGPYYDAAEKEMIYMPERLSGAMQGQEAIPALAKALRGIDQGQVNARAGIGDRGTIPAPIPGREINPLTPENVMRWDPETNSYQLPMESIKGLQEKRKTIRSLRRGGGSGSLDDAEQLRRLGDLEGTLTNRMRSVKSPGEDYSNFDVAEEAFKTEMAPQNRADFAKVVRDKFDTEGGASPLGLLNALRTPGKTAAAAKSPSGKQRIPFEVNSLEHIMGPGQGGARALGQMEALQSAATRDAKLRRVYAPKSVSGELANLGKEVQEVLPPLLSTKITMLKRFADTLGKKRAAETRNIIDNAVLNPDKLVELLRGVDPQDKNGMMNVIRKMDTMGVRPLTGALRSEMSREVGGPQ